MCVCACLQHLSAPRRISSNSSRSPAIQEVNGVQVPKNRSRWCIPIEVLEKDARCAGLTVKTQPNSMLNRNENTWNEWRKKQSRNRLIYYYCYSGTFGAFVLSYCWCLMWVNINYACNEHLYFLCYVSVCLAVCMLAKQSYELLCVDSEIYYSINTKLHYKKNDKRTNE